MRPSQRHNSSNKTSRATAAILLALGSGLILLSLFADAIDLGGGEGFGYQQLIVLIAGLVLLLLGLAAILQPIVSRSSHDTYEPRH